MLARWWTGSGCGLWPCAGGRLIRDTVFGVPTRIAHDLLGLTDPWEGTAAARGGPRQALDDAAKIHPG